MVPDTITWGALILGSVGMFTALLNTLGIHRKAKADEHVAEESTVQVHERVTVESMTLLAKQVKTVTDRLDLVEREREVLRSERVVDQQVKSSLQAEVSLLRVQITELTIKIAASALRENEAVKREDKMTTRISELADVISDLTKKLKKYEPGVS